MDERTKELIAIGASVTANCQPCLEHHAAKAREVGADAAEIKDAIAVGKMVRQGAAVKFDKFILTLPENAAPDAEKGCGCG